MFEVGERVAYVKWGPTDVGTIIAVDKGKDLPYTVRFELDCEYQDFTGDELKRVYGPFV